MRTLALGLLLLLVPVRSLAQPATHAIDRQRAALSALLAGPHHEDEATQLLASLVDYEGMARRILGAQWEARTEAERARYVAALRASMLRSYGPRVAQVREYRVQMGSEEPGEEPVVHMTARPLGSPRAEPWEIACRLHRVDGAWRVIDIVTNQASLVATQARLVQQALASGTWDTLIARLNGASERDAAHQ